MTKDVSTTRAPLRQLAFAMAAIAGLLGSAAVAHAQREVVYRTTEPTMPVSEVRAGMKGYGLSVFSGEKVEKFNVEVIDILHNFLPKQDIVLIRCDDPKLVKSGVVAGMSGSPIYLNGRLIGALAYGWRFSKDPIAGVTPIANMLETARRPLRGIEKTPLAQLTPGRPDNSTAVPVAGAALTQTLTPMSVPLTLAGFAPREAEKLAQALKPFNILAMSGGGGAGGTSASPSAAGQAGGGTRVATATRFPSRAARLSLEPGATNPFKPGSAIGVQLIRGDMSASGTGTVTYVDGDTVIAFGHPMFNVGEVYLPITTARIHTVLPSVERSVKLASPIQEVGSLVQDRQPGIVGDIKRRVGMIPVNITVDGATTGRGLQKFDVEVVRHRFLTPLLVASAVGSAVSEAVSDVADTTFSVVTQVKVKGQAPLVLTDNIYSPQGLSSALEEARGVRALGEILFNPFEPAQIERVQIQVRLAFRANVAEITGAYFTRTELEAGKPATLYVKLRPYNGREETRSVNIQVPSNLAGQSVRFTLTSGLGARPERAPPTDLRQILQNLGKEYPSTSLVVTMRTATDGVTVRGAVIPDLPPSVVDALQPAASTIRGATFKSAARLEQPMGRVLYGQAEILLKVTDRDNGG